MAQADQREAQLGVGLARNRALLLHQQAERVVVDQFHRNGGRNLPEPALGRIECKPGRGRRGIGPGGVGSAQPGGPVRKQTLLQGNVEVDAGKGRFGGKVQTTPGHHQDGPVIDCRGQDGQVLGRA